MRRELRGIDVDFMIGARTGKRTLARHLRADVAPTIDDRVAER